MKVMEVTVGSWIHSEALTPLSYLFCPSSWKGSSGGERFTAKVMLDESPLPWRAETPCLSWSQSWKGRRSTCWGSVAHRWFLTLEHHPIPEGGGERARSPPPRAVSWRTLESQAMTLRDLKGFLFQPAPMVCRWGNGGPETTRASLSSHQGLGAQPGRDAGSVLQLARGGLAVEGDSGKPSGVSSA